MQGSRPPTSGGTCFAGGGGQAPALQGAALPPAVQGSRPPTSGGTCFAGGGGRAPALQGAALPPAVQGSRPPTSGGRCFAGGGGQAPALQGAALPPAVQGSRPPTSGGTCFAGGGGRAPALQGAALPPAAGDGRRRYIRTVIIVSAAVGDECRRCWVPALPRPVVGVSPAAGDEPQPYIRSVALPPAGWGRGPAVQGAVVVVSLAVGDECRRCRVPALPRPVVGVLPAAGDEPQPYRGRRCRRRCWVPALPRPVAGVPPAAGDEPQPYRGRRCRRRRGISAGVTGGGVAAGRLGMSAGGAGVPALPRPVVGVLPAAGDKPQPYIRSVALPPAGWGQVPRLA